MGQFKGQGVVIRSINLGEWDKLLTVFSEGRGKIKVVAKGARKVQSRYASLTQPFCNITFTVYSGKSIHTFGQVTLIESYRAIREDLTKMAYGLYMLELIDIALEDEQAHDDILSLLIACLHILSLTEHVELLLSFFLLRLLNRLGWWLSLAQCPVCGAKSGTRFSIEHLGFPCAQCQRSYSDALVTLSSDGLALLRELSGNDWLRIESLPLYGKGEQEVAAILDRAVSRKMEKKPESYAFLSLIRSTAR